VKKCLVICKYKHSLSILSSDGLSVQPGFNLDCSLGEAEDPLRIEALN